MNQWIIHHHFLSPSNLENLQRWEENNKHIIWIIWYRFFFRWIPPTSRPTVSISTVFQPLTWSLWEIPCTPQKPPFQPVLCPRHPPWVSSHPRRRPSRYPGISPCRIWRSRASGFTCLDTSNWWVGWLVICFLRMKYQPKATNELEEEWKVSDAYSRCESNQGPS